MAGGHEGTPNTADAADGLRTFFYERRRHAIGIANRSPSRIERNVDAETPDFRGRS